VFGVLQRGVGGGEQLLRVQTKRQGGFGSRHTHQFELRARIPGKGSCSVWFLVVSLILCLRGQNCMFSVSFHTVLSKFLGFS